METAATDANGSYEGVTIKRLEEIEPTLSDHNQNVPSAPKAEKEAYEVQSESVTTKNVFKIARNTEGVVTRTCTTGGKGGCPPGGIW
jgi:hypothetical protein